MKLEKNEKVIETEILDALAAIGFFCFKVDRQGTFDPSRKIFRKNNNKHKIKGVSDILGIIGGRFLAIEVKSKTGKLSPDQKIFLRRIQDEGGIAFMARSTEQALNQLLLFIPKNQMLKKYIENNINKDVLTPNHH